MSDLFLLLFYGFIHFFLDCMLATGRIMASYAFLLLLALERKGDKTGKDH